MREDLSVLVYVHRADLQKIGDPGSRFPTLTANGSIHTEVRANPTNNSPLFSQPLS